MKFSVPGISRRMNTSATLTLAIDERTHFELNSVSVLCISCGNSTKTLRDFSYGCFRDTQSDLWLTR